MRAVRCVEQLGLHLGMNEVKLEENGLCQFVMNDYLVLTFEVDEEAECLLLYTVYTNLEKSHSAVTAAKLLQANFFGRETGPAFFAQEEDSGDIYLIMRFPSDESLRYEQFIALLDEFINHAAYWYQQCAQEKSAEGIDENEISFRAGMFPRV